jgi:hypothetical protein
LEHFTVIWYIWWPFGNIVVIWFIFPHFGILCEEKSGNPAQQEDLRLNQISKLSALFPAAWMKLWKYPSHFHIFRLHGNLIFENLRSKFWIDGQRYDETGAFWVKHAFFVKRLPGLGSEPGIFWFSLFSHSIT